jgi:hypothetical protein
VGSVACSTVAMQRSREGTMRCLIMAGKRVNNIQAIARQPPIRTEEMLGKMISVGSGPELCNEDPMPAQGN